MPPGWIVVVRDGSAVVTDLGVTFGAVESVLERRAEADAPRQPSWPAAKQRWRTCVPPPSASPPRRRRRPTPWRRPAADESRAAGARRAAEEAERSSARQLETVVREASWHEAQAERLAAELERARLAIAARTR